MIEKHKWGRAEWKIRERFGLAMKSLEEALADHNGEGPRVMDELSPVLFQAAWDLGSTIKDPEVSDVEKTG